MIPFYPDIVKKWVVASAISATSSTPASDGLRGLFKKVCQRQNTLPLSIHPKGVILRGYLSPPPPKIKIPDTTGTKTTYDYVNGIEYKNTILERIAHSEGQVTRNSSGAYEYEYVLKDHLGNTRVTFKDANNDGIVGASDICQINNFYPFGLNMEGNWNSIGCNGEGNKYGYNGKEWNDDFGLGWNHHDWRFLDVAINRFVTLDPEADEEDQESFSPYHFGADNPVRFSDPDGRIPIIPLIILTIGFLATAEPVNAPGIQDKERDAKAFQEAKKEAALSHASNILPIPGIKGNTATTALNFAKKKAEKAIVKTVVDNKIKKTHGNKLNDTPAEGYSLRDKTTSEVKKYGETTNGETKFGKGNQKRYTKKYLKNNNVDYVKEVDGTKKDMHKWQHDKIKDHKSNNNGQRPDLNKSDY